MANYASGYLAGGIAGAAIAYVIAYLLHKFHRAQTVQWGTVEWIAFMICGTLGGVFIVRQGHAHMDGGRVFYSCVLLPAFALVFTAVGLLFARRRGAV